MKIFRILFSCLFICSCIFISSSTAYCDSYVTENIKSNITWTNFQDDFGSTGYYNVDSIVPYPDNWGKVYFGFSYDDSALFLADYSTGLLTKLLPNLSSFTIDPQNSKHILAIGTFNIYESFDGGNSWNTISNADTFGYSDTQIDPNVRYLQYSPDGSVIYAYSQRPGTGVSSPGWLFASSIDNGLTWRIPIGLQKRIGVGPIAVSNSNPNIVFGRIQENLYKSVDYGLNWQLATNFSLNNGDLAVDPFDENVVFTVYYNYVNYPTDEPMSLLKTIDGGTTWRQLFFPNYANYQYCAINANQYIKGLIYIGVGSSNPRTVNILRSIDGGETWSLLNNLVNSGLGKDSVRITTLVSGPLQSDGGVILYASTGDGKGIYRYVDYPYSGPDLTGTWSSLTQSCKNTKKGINCKVKGNITIENIGNEDAPSSKIRIYISDDNTYDGGDNLLKQVATGKIKPSKSMKKTFSYSFPSGVSISGKYIIALIDADNTVIEPDETNNITVFGPLP
jgi:hypothetical protein